MKLDELCKRADLAIRLGSNDYSLAIGHYIVSYFPKHIQAHLLLGQAFLEQGALAKAAEQFKMVLEVDPENVLARSALGVVYDKLGELPTAIEQFERAYQLNPSNADIADGLRQLYTQRDGEQVAGLKPSATASARRHSKKKQHSLAVQEFDEVVSSQPDRIEVQLGRAEALWRGGLLREAERACIQVLQKAPHTLKAKLILAEIMARDRTREKQGLALLHEALGVDPGGELAKGLFKDTSFQVPDLGDELELPPLDGRVATPPEVEAAISLLPKSAAIDAELDPATIAELELEEVAEIETPKGLASPDILQIQAELERLGNALFQAERPRVEVPQQTDTPTVEAIVTSKKRIIAKYGQEAFDRLDRKLQEFAGVLGSAGVDAKIVYVDDVESVDQLSLSTVDPENPGQVKALIDGLDKNLAGNGRELDNVLIVGGDTIIPFFRMSNPTQDDDENVLSDNPYASRDDNLFIPERALGRMPDAEETDISFILAQLETAMAHRHERSPGAELLGCLGVLLSLGIGVKLPRTRSKSFGYTALVWQEASSSVYGAIDDPRKLQISPPVTDELFDIGWLLGSSFNYFNLHGAKDSEHWYGQKDLTYPEDYPMLPIALSPATVTRASVASSVIFTEACYGANIVGKSPKNSIALRFLVDGALAFVGSTVTSYGVPAPPLSSADLLAVHFWHHLTSGESVGQALKKAKATFKNEMTQRQGWLDGDDQKALLEFVLYGDPSSHLDKVPDKRAKALYQPAKELLVSGPRSRPHLVCKHHSSVKAEAEMPVDLIHKVVSHLHSSCPEMHGASLKIHCAASCYGQCGVNCQRGGDGKRTNGSETFHTLTHFTSRKALQTADGKEVPRFARATLSHVGDIIKTTVSR